MKAKLIKEALNFNRDGSNMDKFDIGMGPAKYIELFEKSLNLLNIEYDLEEDDGILTWHIHNIFDTDYVEFTPKDSKRRKEHHGWHLFMEGFEKDPFNIINTLIRRKYGNIKDQLRSALDKIEEAKEEYDYFINIEKRIKEVNNIIEKEK
jgi:hypothetical protein